MPPDQSPAEGGLAARRAEYWRRTRGLTAILMGVWFVVSFVLTFFARELSAWNFFGWPLSFYMSAQGSLIIFVVIIWLYARRMDRLDRQFRDDADRSDQNGR